MELLRLLLRNTLRHKLRSLLTVVGVGVAVMAFALLQTVVTAWYAGVEASAANRLITRHAVSFVFPLPLAYRDRIAQVPGVNKVTYAIWFSGVYVDKNQFFARLAVDDSNEGQREHDARQGHQRCRRHGEDRLNGRGRAGHRRADDGPIERQQRQGQPDAGHHAGQRQQPQPSLGQVAQPEAPNPPHDCGHPRITPTTVGYPATPRPTRRPGSSGECRYGRRGALARRAARHRKCANRRRHSARRLASSPAGTGNAITHSHG